MAKGWKGFIQSCVCRYFNYLVGSQMNPHAVATALQPELVLDKISTYMFLMRDEKEERSKQGQTNKQGKATAHPRQSLFLEKMSCLGWDSNPRHSHVHVIMYAALQRSFIVAI